MSSKTSGFQLSDHAAQLYERDSVPMTTRPLAELMFAHVSLHEGERILDVACGTGIVARLAAERIGRSGQIIGIDLNPGMLDVARANSPTTGASVEWRQGDAQALPFPDESFDLVLCQQGMQYVSDKLAALREMQRVLAPGGRLAFTVWGEVSSYNAALADALARHVSAAVAARALAPNAWSDAASIRHLVGEAEFRDIDVQELVLIVRRPSSAESVLAQIARSPYAEDVAAVSEAARLAIGQEVSAALQAYGDGDDCVCPQKTHLVQARADGFWNRFWRNTRTAWTQGFPEVPS
ncbi:MAG: methyltransferase domain-containing protein [Candidatus Tectomicrobia bacterium]|nr:methyltransferase domain-containing protein [Candidatus Tectomicrobia bacterium]